MKKTLMALLVVGLVAVAADAAVSSAAHYTFDETAPGNWEVYIDVSGDTTGLSAYSVWVYNVTPSMVTYTENVLGTEVSGVPTGFQSATLVAGDVDGSFNAGNYQIDPDLGYVGISGIGMAPVNVVGDSTTVDLAAHALLGVLSTPEGLTENDFSATVIGMLNLAGDGFITEADLPVATFSVNPLVALPGDANNDGVVDGADFNALLTNWGAISGDNWAKADFNGDDVVDGADFNVILSNWTVGGASVPEPATMSLLALGGLAVLRRRRK